MAEMVEELTPREWEVAQWWAAGYSAPEIAEALVKSPRTVETQIKTVKEKLGLHNRYEVVEYVRVKTGQIHIELVTNITIVNNICDCPLDVSGVSVCIGV